MARPARSLPGARLLAPSPTRGWTGTRCPFLVPGTRCRAAEVGSLEAGVGDIHRRHPPVLAPGPVEAAVVDLDVEEPEDLELRSAEVQGLQPAPFELDEPSQLLDEPPVQLVAPHPPRQGCAPARRSTRPWCSPRPRSSSRPPDRRRAMTSAANRSPSPPSHRSIVRSTSRRRCAAGTARRAAAWSPARRVQVGRWSSELHVSRAHLGVGGLAVAQRDRCGPERMHAQEPGHHGEEGVGVRP